MSTACPEHGPALPPALAAPRPALLTRDQIAAIFRMHPKSVDRWARQGRIIRRPGGYLAADVDKLTGRSTP